MRELPAQPEKIFSENFTASRKKFLQNFYQINISINPFRPEYVRVLKSGYSLDELYQPIRKVGDDFEQEEALLSDDYKSTEIYIPIMLKMLQIL